MLRDLDKKKNNKTPDVDDLFCEKNLEGPGT